MTTGGRSLSAQDMETMLTAARVFAAITAESIAQAGAGIALPQLRVLVSATSCTVWIPPTESRWSMH